MSDRLAVYNQDALELIVLAIPIIDARGEMVLEAESPRQYEVIEAPDGTVIRYTTKSRVYPVKLNLQQVSIHHDALSEAHAQDFVAVGGSGIGAFFAKDNGSTNMIADYCWIAKPPTRGYGRAPRDDTWELTVISSPAKMRIGGLSIDI
jgi:hypothetical protein